MRNDDSCRELLDTESSGGHCCYNDGSSSLEQLLVDAQVETIVWSPDGSKVAAVVVAGTDSRFAPVTGKIRVWRADTLDLVSEVDFTPDLGKGNGEGKDGANSYPYSYPNSYPYPYPYCIRTRTRTRTRTRPWTTGTP